MIRNRGCKNERQRQNDNLTVIGARGYERLCVCDDKTHTHTNISDQLYLDAREQKGAAPLKGLRHIDFSAGFQQSRGGVQRLDRVGHQRDRAWGNMGGREKYLDDKRA